MLGEFRLDGLGGQDGRRREMGGFSSSLSVRPVEGPALQETNKKSSSNNFLSRLRSSASSRHLWFAHRQ